MQKIQVLMSTYNGEKYLKEQIDSILKQDCEEKTGVCWSLLVRDDGSKDCTQLILEKYHQQYPDKIQWYQGENRGVIGSFFELMQKADDEAVYYAFADQDDVWMPEKLSRGIEFLAHQTGKCPALYACRPKLVDAELKELTSEIKRPPMRPAFENALIENIVTGCTAVFNAELRNLVVKELPEFTMMHDWWLYLVATLFGKVYYDEKSYIAYRQHGKNVVGNPVSRMAEIKERVRVFFRKRSNISRQTASLLRIFGKLEREELQKYRSDKEVINRLSLAKTLLLGRKSCKLRIRLVRSGKLYRQRKNDHRIYQWILLSGKY